MAKEGISRSFRLHPSDEREKQAIEIIEEWEGKGLSIREIVTNALLRSAGYTPDMFRVGDEKLTPALLESILTDFGRELIQTIRENGIPVSGNEPIAKKPSPFDEDEDTDSMQNLIKAHASRSGRK